MDNENLTRTEKADFAGGPFVQVTMPLKEAARQ